MSKTPTLMNQYGSRALYEQVKRGLTEVGYSDLLIHEDYRFADILSPDYSVGTVQLAAFAQHPPSYRNACFGVVVANGIRGIPLIDKCRSLGAPQIFEVARGYVNRWKMTPSGPPVLLDHLSPDALPELFDKNRDTWSPAQVLRAKSAGQVASQLDFFDLGLLPLLEQQARKKLDRLLRDTVVLSIEAFQTHSSFTDDDYAPLFRLLFRLIAAKVLADRGHPGNWTNDDPRVVVAAVQDFYSKDLVPEAVLQHFETQVTAWERIRKAFHFQNLSVESLAYVYETTLVAPQTRSLFGIHSTPPAIAEYIIRNLPFEDLPLQERRVFEPFSGHSVFLVAAMQRLRELLQPDMTSSQRHEYFVSMLSGIELDDFALEVARLSLLLADYPNSDGWRLYGGDAWVSHRFEDELRLAQIVVCNPPFEDFNLSERAKYSLSSTRKPAEILQRVLSTPPALLGFVLPRSFSTGRSYRAVRSLLGHTYSSIDLVALPDKVFLHSDAEAVLLLASKKGGRQGYLRTGVVDRSDLDHFYTTHKLTQHSGEAFDASTSSLDNGIWLPALQEVWEATSQMKRLGDLAEIHRGIEYNIPFQQNKLDLVSAGPRPGFVPGIQKVKDALEPFLLRKPVHLNLSLERMRGSAYRHPWHERKLIVNAARRKRGAWPIAASIDYQGLVCYQNFHGVWPNCALSLESLAAILNGPVANAFVATREGKRDVQIQTLEGIPFPKLDSGQDEAISSLVRQYIETRTRWLYGSFSPGKAHATCIRLLQMIDAEVLRAYDLAPRTERMLLDYFLGQVRPGPAGFQEYFPESFKPNIPYYQYLSDETADATATATLGRLSIIDDPIIAEAMEYLYSDESE